MPNAPLSDKALSIIAFAAYHQLESGQKVTSVVRRDGKGHQADDEGVAELESRGLATASEAEISFTQEGAPVVQRAVEALRQAAG
jgi:hypothetical protein